MGVWGGPIDVEPEVALPSARATRNSAGVRIRRTSLTRYVERNGVRIAVPIDAFITALGEVDQSTAVSLLDSALYRRVIAPGELVAIRDAVAGRRGSARHRGTWNLVDGRAQSPAETWARLQCTNSGYPPDVLQLPFVDQTGHVRHRVDLAWWNPDGSWLLGEIDGIAFHSGVRDTRSDLRRQNTLAAHGTILRWTGREAQNGDVAHEVQRFLQPRGWIAGRKTPQAEFLR
jgi:hypothetical protein